MKMGSNHMACLALTESWPDPLLPTLQLPLPNMVWRRLGIQVIYSPGCLSSSVASHVTPKVVECSSYNNVCGTKKKCVIKVLFNGLQMAGWFTALCEQPANPGQGIIHKCDCGRKSCSAPCYCEDSLLVVLVKPCNSGILCKIQTVAPWNTAGLYSPQSVSWPFKFTRFSSSLYESRWPYRTDSVPKPSCEGDDSSKLGALRFAGCMLRLIS